MSWKSIWLHSAYMSKPTESTTTDVLMKRKQAKTAQKNRMFDAVLFDFMHGDSANATHTFSIERTKKNTVRHP